MQALTLTGNNVNYIVASNAEPFTVFGAPYSTGCPGQVIKVGSSGTLESAEANITYSSDSGIHGLALSSDNRFIYSGDDMGTSIWTHSYDEETTSVSKLQRLNVTGNPRHLAVSPQGSFIYVILEQNNQLAVFNRDETTGYLSGRNKTFSLLPSGKTTNPLNKTSLFECSLLSISNSGYSNSSLYWSDEVMFSVPQEEGKYPKYLFATVRSRTLTDPGFVAAYSLDSTTGAISDSLFIVPTTGSGGASNSITPAIFSEEFFAIADAQGNFIEVWKLGEGTTTATVVAHLDVSDSPANLVWVD
jgi:carboxy-cis,cis-muconate cyclase